MHLPPVARMRVLASVASLLVIAAMATPATSQESADLFEDGHEHLDSETAPSFNESDGCDQPSGYRGPYVRQTGVQPNNEPVLGPWGDFFGRDILEIINSRVAMQLPGMNTPKDFLVHERVAPALQQVINRLQEEAANGNTYEIRAEHSFSYNPRTIGGRLSLSFHASGSAIDINSTTNPYRADNVLITDIPAWFVKAWTDAGFCWGGDFQTIKDAMHFSWQGPLATPGYGDTPPPYPPRTSSANFTALGANETMAFGDHAPGALQFLEDADRNGAPDVIQVEPLDTAGRVFVTAVRAHQDFETCRFGFVSAVGVMAPGRRVVVGDGDRDGRPDLWSIDETSDSVVVSVYSYASGFQRRVRRVVTGIEPDPSNEYLIGDHNVDGYADLYAVERTAAGKRLRIDVWDGASDFASTIVGRNVNITDDTTGGTWHFALGDRDVDGVPDLYAFEAVDPVIAHISLGGKRFGGRPTTFDTGAPPSLALRLDVGDYDGDGRDDLYSIRTDGKLRVYLGGVQPAGADLSYWFRDPASWTAGDGCPTTASLADAITIGDITSDGVDEIAALHRKLGDTAYTVDIHNRATNKQVAEFAVSPTSTSFDLETLAVDGKVAVATLGRRHGDGLSVIRVQLVEGGAAISAFISGGGFIPADIEIGTDGNGDSFLAVAEYRLHPLVARVNTFTPEGVLVDTVNYGSFVPIDLEVVPDFTGDGEPEFALLGTNPGQDAPITKLRSSVDGRLLRSIKMKSGFTPAALVQVPSFAGGPGAELAVMGEDTVRGRTFVIVTDGERKDLLRTIIQPKDWRSVGIAVMEDYGGTAAPEIALAIRRESDDRVTIRVYDASSGARLLNSKTKDIHRPVSLFTANHKNGNGKETILLARLRDADPRVLVIERNASTGKKVGSYVIR